MRALVAGAQGKTARRLVRMRAEEGCAARRLVRKEGEMGAV